jgi:flagellar basal-body rod protein FlgC
MPFSNMLSVLDIASSAMSAQTTLLTTTASNMANADNVSNSPTDIYKERVPVFAAIMEDACRDAAVPVQVLGIVEKNLPAVKEYNPGHPKADANGFIYKTNVNVTEQVTNGMVAARSYQAIAKIAQSIEEVSLKTIAAGG